MKFSVFCLLVTTTLFGLASWSLSAEKKRKDEDSPPPEPPPIRALLLSGGCSHDYQARSEILVRGISERVARSIKWRVEGQAEDEGDRRIPLFDSAEWARDYDIVVHDHCYPRVEDRSYIDRVLLPHREGIPAVLLHGTMMSFRAGGEEWSEFTGVSTSSHEREGTVIVEHLVTEHPILKGFSPWTIEKEELYRIDRLHSGVQALTESLDPTGVVHSTTWTHRYGPAKTRVFGTSLGNATATVASPVYLDLIARGFLWSLDALSDENIVTVAPEDSLKGLKIDLSTEPGLRFGWNAATTGVASAFSWGRAGDERLAARAIDGDSTTLWTSPNPGPGSWQVRLPEASAVSLVAIDWGSTAPAEAVLEGKREGQAWKTLASINPPPDGGSLVIARFPSEELRELRLSVIATGGQGAGFSLREFGAYADESDLPSALLAAVPDDPHGPRFHTVGFTGVASQIRLLPDWQLVSLQPFPAVGRVGQVVPTAAGDCFVSVFPHDESEKNGVGSVYRFGKTNDETTIVPYFTGIDQNSLITWDGEWLYILSGDYLKRIRKALGPGPADEGQRLGQIFSLSETEGPKGLRLSDLHLGSDGWLYLRVECETPGMVTNRDGRTFRVPRSGMLRFRRDGTGLFTAPSEADDDHAMPTPSFVEASDFTSQAQDGELLWGTMTNEGRLCLVSIAPKSMALPQVADWNGIEADSIIAQLNESRPSLRREAMCELLRRKRDPLPDLETALAASPTPDMAMSLVGALAARRGGGSSELLALLEQEDLNVKVAALRALGDLPELEAQTALIGLEEPTDALLSAALIEGLRRSGGERPGAEAVAMRLLSHLERSEATSVRTFLIEREAFEAAFAVLDNPTRSAEWANVCGLLASMRHLAVVEGLSARLRATGNPKLRRLVLETLCALRFSERRDQTSWAGTAAIDEILKHSLKDRRVDRAALLAAMTRTGIDLPPAEDLVTLAREDLSLEVLAIEALERSSSTLSDPIISWLRELTADRSRDGEVKIRAEMILTRIASTSSYKTRFAEVARTAELAMTEALTRTVFEQWFERSDHLPNLSWLKGVVSQGGEKGILACQTLLVIWDSPALSSREGQALGEWFVAGGKESGTFQRVLFQILEQGPLEPAGKLLALLFKNAEPASAELLQSIAEKRRLNLRTGKPEHQVRELSISELREAVDSSADHIEQGRAAFIKFDCRACHNLDREGSALGPDLATLIEKLSQEELIETLLASRERITVGYETSLIETKDGRRWWGKIEGHAGEWIDLRDRAGNHFQLSKDQIVQERLDGTSSPRCQPIDEASLSEFTALVHYLRSLKPF